VDREMVRLAGATAVSWLVPSGIVGGGSCHGVHRLALAPPDRSAPSPELRPRVVDEIKEVHFELVYGPLPRGGENPQNQKW
jgi:hypothetical protein